MAQEFRLEKRLTMSMDGFEQQERYEHKVAKSRNLSCTRRIKRGTFLPQSARDSGPPIPTPTPNRRPDRASIYDVAILYKS